MIDFNVIRNCWTPSEFTLAMERNPITKVFWSVILWSCGYEDQYRCTHWDAATNTIRHWHPIIKIGDPQYNRFYYAVQNYLYYNPQDRQEFYMAPPPTTPPPIIIRGASSPIVIANPISQQPAPPMPAYIQPGGASLHQRGSPVPAPHLPSHIRPGVPLAQQNALAHSRVPPMDSPRAGLPLSQQNTASHTRDDDDAHRRANALSKQNTGIHPR